MEKAMPLHRRKQSQARYRHAHCRTMAAPESKVRRSAPSTRVPRERGKKSSSTRYHKNVLQMGKFDGRCQLCLPVQFPHTKTFHNSDEQTRRKDTANSRSINFLTRLQISLL